MNQPAYVFGIISEFLHWFSIFPFSSTFLVVQITERNKETINSGKKCEDPVCKGGRSYSKHSFSCLFAVASPWLSQTVRAAGLHKKVLDSTQEKERERRRFLACIEHLFKLSPMLTKPLTNVILLHTYNNSIQ